MATAAPQLRKALRGKAPGLHLEQELWSRGYDVVVGVDEVGKGAWAGPLSVGAVVVNRDRRVNKIRDSKMLHEDEREVLYERIVGWADAWSVGHATHEECDELGMSEAQRVAARRALECLGVSADRVLLDGKWDFVGGGRAETHVKGDAKSLSIAAASIVAKVTRDRIMRELAPCFPSFAFAGNKGYPCPRHRAALQAYGPTSIHRQSWAFMDDLPWPGVRRFERPDPQASLF